MPINRDLFDDIISDALDLLRLSANEKAEAFEKLKRLERELIVILSENEIAKLGKRQINRLLKSADEIIAGGYVELASGIELVEIASTIADATAGAFEVVFGSDAIKVPTKSYFDSLLSNVLIFGAPSNDWWQAQELDLQRKFAQQVRMGAAQGETNQQIIQRIVGKQGEPGIMDVTRRNAASLVQTSVQTVANDARRQTFFANPDIVEGLMQVSTLDSHTTIICVSYSGEQWDLELEPINGSTLEYNGGVPRHWNCRSVEVPITKSFRDLGIDIDEPAISTRASSQGQIRADTSFDQFLKRRGEQYQNDVLGEGRAELWRAGKITLKDLVNGNGQPLNLSQLQAIVAKRRSN